MTWYQKWNSALTDYWTWGGSFGTGYRESLDELWGPSMWKEPTTLARVQKMGAESFEFLRGYLNGHGQKLIGDTVSEKRNLWLGTGGEASCYKVTKNLVELYLCPCVWWKIELNMWLGSEQRKSLSKAWKEQNDFVVWGGAFVFVTLLFGGSVDFHAQKVPDYHTTLRSICHCSDSDYTYANYCLGVHSSSLTYKPGLASSSSTSKSISFPHFCCLPRSTAFENHLKCLLNHKGCCLLN